MRSSSQWLKVTTQETAGADDDAEPGTPLRCWGECELVQPLRTPGWSFLQKPKHRATLRVHPNDTKILIQRGTRTPMFVAALSTKAKLWRTPTAIG